MCYCGYQTYQWLQRRQECQCWASSWVTHSHWDSMSILILTSSIQGYVIISINLYRNALAGLMIQATFQRDREQRDEQRKEAPRIQELFGI